MSVKELDRDSWSNGLPADLPSDFQVLDLRGLSHLKVSKCYPRGSVLFVEGQPPDGIYLLREGRAKVSIGSAEGKKLVLRIAQPGDLLGMNATLTGQPYGATVETLDRGRVDFLSRLEVLKLLAEDHRAYERVARALSRKLNSVVDHARLLFLSQSSAEKLARLLVKWCEESGKRTPQGIRIDSGLTHEELAQMICASRETVTRLLSEFKRKRIVSLDGDSILIRNRQALESVAQGHSV